MRIYETGNVEISSDLHTVSPLVGPETSKTEVRSIQAKNTRMEFTASIWNLYTWKNSEKSFNLQGEVSHF